FSQYGGCTLQHLNAAYYRAFKQRKFYSSVKQLVAPTTQPMQFLDAASRRRVEFRLHRQGGRLAFAFFEPRSHTKVPEEQCIVHDPALQQLMPRLIKALEALPGIEQVTMAGITLADSGIDLFLTCHAAPDIEALSDMANTL